MAIPIASRWIEVATGRTVVVVGPGPNSPWWYYEDDPNRIPWHCCVEDFLVWNRFHRIS